MATESTTLTSVRRNLPILLPKLIPNAIPLFSKKWILNQSSPKTFTSSPIAK